MDGSKKLKRVKTILYFTIGLAIINSWLFEISTSDYAHRVFSEYFFIETAILAVTIVGFENRRTRILVALLTLAELAFFLIKEKPYSPDELLSIIIFGLRVYALLILFGKAVNQFYQDQSKNKLDEK